MQFDLLRATKNLPHIELDIPDDLLTEPLEYEFTDDQSLEQQIAICHVVASYVQETGDQEETDRRVMAVYDFANRVSDKHVRLGAIIGIYAFGINHNVVRYISAGPGPFTEWNEKFINYFNLLDRNNNPTEDQKDVTNLLRGFGQTLKRYEQSPFVSAQELLDGILNGFSDELTTKLDKAIITGDLEDVQASQ